MRSLTQITNAVRRADEATEQELRAVIVAYDVLLVKMNVQQDPEMLKQFFKAAESDPEEYIGWENDPRNPEAIEWHRAHINMDQVFDGAREILKSEGKL